MLQLQRQPQPGRQRCGLARAAGGGDEKKLSDAVPEEVPEQAKEAVKTAEDNLQQAGRSAKEALQDTGRQVKRQTRGADDIPEFDLPTAVAMGVCAFEV